MSKASIRQQRYRDSKRNASVTNPVLNVTPTVTRVTPEVACNVTPANYGQPDCECRHCANNRAQNNRLLINHGPYKTAAELKSNEVNRQTMSGDADYEGIMRHEGGGLDEGFTPNGAGAE